MFILIAALEELDRRLLLALSWRAHLVGSFWCCSVNVQTYNHVGWELPTCTRHLHLYRTPMSEDWDFVESWLDDIPGSQPDKIASIEPPEPVHEAFAAAAPRITNLALPPTPPASSWPGKPSPAPHPAAQYQPLKRKRSACAHSNPQTGMSSPRKRTGTHDDQASATTATSAFSDIRLTAGSRSSSPTKVRASSPVRELRNIYAFASPPLKCSTAADADTPRRVLELIRGLPLHGVGVIPGSLKVWMLSVAWSRL